MQYHFTAKYGSSELCVLHNKPAPLHVFSGLWCVCCYLLSIDSVREEDGSLLKLKKKRLSLPP